MKTLFLSLILLCLGAAVTIFGQNPYSNPAFLFCPSSGACATPAATTARSYAGVIGLNSSGAASISFPAFTSATTYSCVGTDESGNASIQIAHTSTTQANLTGTASHTISFICTGY